MQLKGIVFDFDGTLAETWPICFEAFRNAFMKHTGKHYTDEEIEAMFGPDEEGIIKRILPVGWEAGVQTYLEEYERAHTLCESLFPGIEDALTLLSKRNIALAMATGKGMGSTVISLKRLGLDGYFDVVEAGHAVGGRKWDSIENILAAWGFRPEEVAYVGDAPTDVDAARKAGVAAIGAAWSVHSNKAEIEAKSPDILFASVAEFQKWAESLPPRQLTD